MESQKIYSSASEGFGQGAAAYEKGRPDYPALAVSHLLTVLNIKKGTTLVDLAAGTGKFTRLIVPSKAEVIAIEPVEGMRREFAEKLPKVRLL